MKKITYNDIHIGDYIEYNIYDDECITVIDKGSGIILSIENERYNYYVRNKDMLKFNMEFPYNNHYIYPIIIYDELNDSLFAIKLINITKVIKKQKNIFYKIILKIVNKFKNIFLFK